MGSVRAPGRQNVSALPEESRGVRVIFPKEMHSEPTHGSYSKRRPHPQAASNRGSVSPTGTQHSVAKCEFATTRPCC